MSTGIATFGSSPTANTGVTINGSLDQTGYDPYNTAVVGDPNNQTTTGTIFTGSGSTGVLGDSTVNNNYSAQQIATNQANAYIDQQIANLNDLLGRTDTGLNQGLTQLNDSYISNKTTQQNQEDQAIQDYGDKRVATTKDRGTAYNTINKNGNNGYRSLSQLIGRASGTGSSAFQEALPDAIGREISSKRNDANLTYGTNMGNIDTAQKKTENSFAQILQDLANQRADQERALRSGVEGQKQNILGQEQQLQAQRGNLAGAQALQPQIESSRNAVESFFNQFKPTLTAQQAPIAAPDISKYTVDRANINAQNQNPGQDTSNPYALILKKQQQQAQGV